MVHLVGSYYTGKRTCPLINATVSVSDCRERVCRNFGIKRNRMELNVSVMFTTRWILCALRGAPASLPLIIWGHSPFSVVPFNVFNWETAVK